MPFSDAVNKQGSGDREPGPLAFSEPHRLLESRVENVCLQDTEQQMTAQATTLTYQERLFLSYRIS